MAGRTDEKLPTRIPPGWVRHYREELNVACRVRARLALNGAAQSRSWRSTTQR